MHSRLRCAGAILLTLAIAAIALGDLESWAAAMACCGAADYECAGVGAPDDCCQTMGHVAGVPTAAPPATRMSLAAVSCSPASVIAVPSLDRLAQSLTLETFKRPHDPPHLHPIPLLV